MQEKYLQNTGELEKLYRSISRDELIKAGILEDNLGKVRLGDGVRYGILEQKATVRAILTELKLNIEATAYFLRNRNAEDVFSVRSHFSRAVKRLKQMIESGYRTTKLKALRQAQVFLYGDPDAHWVTMGDSKVCMYCRVIERAGWMPLSMLPLVPLHNRCRCHIELREKKPDLTDEAMALMYYMIGSD